MTLYRFDRENQHLVLAAETDKNLSVKEKSFSKKGFRKKQKQFCCANNYKNVYCKIEENLLFYENLLFIAAVNWFCIRLKTMLWLRYVTIAAADNINFKLFLQINSEVCTQLSVTDALKHK